MQGWRVISGRLGRGRHLNSGSEAVGELGAPDPLALVPVPADGSCLRVPGIYRGRSCLRQPDSRARLDSIRALAHQPGASGQFLVTDSKLHR